MSQYELDAQTRNLSVIELRDRVKNEETKAYEDKEGTEQLYALVNGVALRKLSPGAG